MSFVSAAVLSTPLRCEEFHWRVLQPMVVASVPVRANERTRGFHTQLNGWDFMIQWVGKSASRWKQKWTAGGGL